MRAATRAPPTAAPVPTTDPWDDPRWPDQSFALVIPANPSTAACAAPEVFAARSAGHCSSPFSLPARPHLFQALERRASAYLCPRA
ncbi:hypothetical protein [Actinokineospora globicatena]|uniref:hypothetical protein n=1 Tax=Actinokineospora globicatena TaxID=103729 RepID=UPI002553F951|nr:hypothetical protein [Actinokineospora globicatena]